MTAAVKMPEAMPQRVQLRRTKGWRKPEGAVVVSRPSHWGNPYTVKRVDCELGGCCWNVGHRESLHPVFDHLDTEVEARALAANSFRDDLEHGRLSYGIGVVRAYLRGRDLACWCPLSAPCHADVLLELANR